MGKYALSKKQRKFLWRIIISLTAFFAVFITDKIVTLSAVFGGKFGWAFPFVLYLLMYLFIGYDVLIRAVKNIARGQALDENFLMCVATVGAFSLAIYRGANGLDTEGFDEACAVLLFYQVGEFFQNYATGRSRRSIAELMDIRPDYANVLRDGTLQTVEPNEVRIGEIILVDPGEKIPLDGVVVKGASAVDNKALTGESAPQNIREGETVLSGGVNLTSRLEIRVTKEFYDSTVSKILDLVENASDKKSKTENFITQFARYYTPIVVGLAVGLAVLPPLFTGAWSKWLYRALGFLVVSCPCALVISVPMSFFAGLGAASRQGILIKGSNYLEKFDKVNTFVFDKTGTLTKGNFVVTGVYPEENAREILRLAATAEQGSSHPIATAIKQSGQADFENGYTLTNQAGEGVIATKNDDVILCGNQKLMARYGVAYEDIQTAETVVYVAKNGVFVGKIDIADEIKAETKQVLSALNKTGKTVMLTGDRSAVAQRVAKETGVSGYKAELLPQDKVAEVEKLLADKQGKTKLCFVGDGINDAPVLMRSDVGVAMGALGSDAAIEAADIVLMKDDLKGLLIAKEIARKTMRIVKQNILFSLAVKGAILILSAFGVTNMWIAVFGDVGVAVIAILNAMRVGVRRDKRK